MKLVVVGASGFLGRHTLALARARGIPCVGTRTRSADPALVPFDLRDGRLRDALPQAFCDRALVAILCAAISQPEKCARDPDSRSVNVIGMKRAAEDVAALGGRVIFLSTGFVFDGARGGYTEDDAPSPLNEYGRQKVEMEQFFAGRTDAMVARVDKLVGDAPDEAHLFHEWQDAIDTGRPIVCLRGQELSPISVDDAAAALLWAAERGTSGLHHLAAPERWLRDDLARRYLALTKQQVRDIVLKDPEDLGMTEPRPLRASLDGARFARLSGLRARSMDDLMQSYFEQHRSARS